MTRRRDALEKRHADLEARFLRRADARHAAFDKWASRLAPALHRLIAQADRQRTEGQAKLAALSARLDAAPVVRLADLRRRLDALDRMRQSLGYTETLKRGYAVVRAGSEVVTDAAQAATHPALEIQFRDGRLAVSTNGAEPARPTAKHKARRDEGPDQGSLF